MEQKSTYVKIGHDTKLESKDFGSGIRIQIILINWINYKYNKIP